MYYANLPLMNTITGCVPYLAMQGVSVNLKVPVKIIFIVWNEQVLTSQGTTLPELSLKFLKTFVEMYIACIHTMVSGEIEYSASRPVNSKEMYKLARLVQDTHNLIISQ